MQLDISEIPKKALELPLEGWAALAESLIDILDQTVDDAAESA